VLQLSWARVCRVKVNLYEELPRPMASRAPSTSWIHDDQQLDDWAQVLAAVRAAGIPNMSCPGQIRPAILPDLVWQQAVLNPRAIAEQRQFKCLTAGRC